jgi:hypothetical protein
VKAFHNDMSIKNKYTARVLAHFEADELIKGRYWENGRGCAVGCTIHGAEHARYETELGIPEWLALLEDTIFEGLPLERAKVWPSEFLNVIHVGAELEKVKAPFMIFILKSTLDKFDHEKSPEVKAVVERVIALYERGDATQEEFAARAAWAAEAADAARAAAWAARAEAWAEAAAEAAAWAAADRAYIKFADELLRLMRDCKPELEKE